MTKPTLRITRWHLTDLECAAMNDPACQPILDEIKKNYELIIDEKPVPGVFYHDMSINFMYPYGIQLYDIDKLNEITNTGKEELLKLKVELNEIFDGDRLANLASFAALENTAPHFEHIRKTVHEFKLYDFGARGVDRKLTTGNLS